MCPLACCRIPDSCEPRLRFVTSQSQAALANKVAAKAWNCSEVAELTYKVAMEQVGGSSSSKQLYSVDPEEDAGGDTDDDE